MVDALDFLLQGGHVFHIHSFRDHHRDGAGPELVEQDILPSHRLDLIRQVSENIVVYACVQISECRRNEKQDRQDEDRDPHFYNSLSETLHIYTSFLISFRTT